MPKLSKTMSVAGIILVLSFIFISSVIFQGETLYAFDTLLTYLPWSSLVGDARANNQLTTDPVNVLYPSQSLFRSCIASSRLCFRNPMNFCGLPVSPPANPLLFLLHLVFSHTTAHVIFLWLNLIGAGA